MAPPKGWLPTVGSVRGGDCSLMGAGEGICLGLRSRSVLGLKLEIRVKVRISVRSELGVRIGVRGN